MSNYNQKDGFFTTEYGKNFWAMMRDSSVATDKLINGHNTDTGTYAVPYETSVEYDKALQKTSLFRNISTVVKAYGAGYRILAKESDDLAAWVSEGQTIPIYDGADDFSTIPVSRHKLAVFTKLTEEFARDASFNIEDYLANRLARNFGRAETSAFITGTGVDMPTGILHNTAGAEVALTADALSYDAVLGLYFAVKPEYRQNAVWLMNDATAMALRTLKDDVGNYLWRNSDNTILGKQVLITEYMPNVSAGAKPILFGDFSYYWIVERKPLGVRTLTEKFAVYGQIGYLAYEYLDAKLIRRDAVKVLQIASDSAGE